MKNIFLLAILTLFLLQSCGESKPTDSNTETTESATGTPTTTETDTPAETTTESTSSDNASVITDAVMTKVCDCVKESGEEESDIDKIKECMGGSSAEYVARLLGDGASEKQKTDAQNELQERMQEQCPLLRK
jgi:hypothetical protein